MARSVANLHKSHEEIEQQNLTSSPLMRNSYNEGANSSKQNQSQQAFEVPYRMNVPSELSQERNDSSLKTHEQQKQHQYGYP